MCVFPGLAFSFEQMAQMLKTTSFLAPKLSVVEKNCCWSVISGCKFHLVGSLFDIIAYLRLGGQYLERIFWILLFYSHESRIIAVLLTQ